MRFELTDKGKFYVTGGQAIPSVSTVLSAIDELENGPPFGLIKWRQKEVAAGRDPSAATTRGTKVHSFAEAYSYCLDRQFCPEIAPEIAPYVEQLIPALDQIYLEWGPATHREHYCQGSWFGGSLDQAILGDTPVILDFKTIGKPTALEYGEAELGLAVEKYQKKVSAYKAGDHQSAIRALRQLRGYAAAWGGQNGFSKVQTIVLGITPDESFKIEQTVTVPDCVAEWDAMKPVYEQAVLARDERRRAWQEKELSKALQEASESSAMMESLMMGAFVL